jgi:hypothetical protein
VSTKALRILSLGWGVQSWTLAAMAALGEFEPLDYAVHADTSWERSATYAHARKWTPWLEEHGLKVVTVKGKRTTVVVEEWGKGSVMIPAYTTDRVSGKAGQIRRQCTHDWKIMPIRAFIRQELKSRRFARTSGAVDLVQGISFDEWHRMRDSDVRYIVNRYPLVDQRITRADCVSWLRAHQLDVPVKSSCVFCPYHSLGEWRRLKSEGGPDWAIAVEVDSSIRDRRPKHSLYVHPGRVPLTKAVRIPEDEGAQQLQMECDGGVCFV